MTSYDVLITSCLVNGSHLILDFHKTFVRMKVRKPRNQLLFTRDALRGHTVSKNGTISFSSS